MTLTRDALTFLQFDNMIRRINEAIRSLRAEEILRAINCFQNTVDASQRVLNLNI